MYCVVPSETRLCRVKLVSLMATDAYPGATGTRVTPGARVWAETESRPSKATISRNAGRETRRRCRQRAGCSVFTRYRDGKPSRYCRNRLLLQVELRPQIFLVEAAPTARPPTGDEIYLLKLDPQHRTIHVDLVAADGGRAAVLWVGHLASEIATPNIDVFHISFRGQHPTGQGLRQLDRTPGGEVLRQDVIVPVGDSAQVLVAEGVLAKAIEPRQARPVRTGPAARGIGDILQTHRGGHCGIGGAENQLHKAARLIPGRHDQLVVVQGINVHGDADLLEVAQALN